MSWKIQFSFIFQILEEEITPTIQKLKEVYTVYMRTATRVLLTIGDVSKGWNVYHFLGIIFWGKIKS